MCVFAQCNQPDRWYMHLHMLVDILIGMDPSADISVIESRIDRLVKQYTGAIDGMTIPHPCAAVLNSITEQARISSQGGKRLRALLTLTAYDAACSSYGASIPKDSQRLCATDLACAIEVFQTGALVHDDIIDDSDLRRGKPSAHINLASTFAHWTNPLHQVLQDASGSETVDTSAFDSSDSSYGKGLGIMLGDILATASIEIARNASQTLPKAQEIIEAFLTMHREVEIGQVLDLGVEHVPLNNPTQLVTASLGVFRWKTASYTTIAPIELGLLAAGVKQVKAHAAAQGIGMSLGLAFQLADDLLDVVSDSEHTGKPVGGDIREGKRTVLLADALSNASDADRAYLIAAYESRNRSPEQVSRIIGLFDSTGAIERSRERIGKLWRSSQVSLAATVQTLNLTPEAADRLYNACARFIPPEMLES